MAAAVIQSVVVSLDVVGPGVAFLVLDDIAQDKTVTSILPNLRKKKIPNASAFGIFGGEGGI